MSLSLQIVLQEEQAVIRAIIRQEAWAQRKLYEAYYGRMMGVCLRYANTPEDALDILQDGFLKVFRNIHKYNEGTSLSAWIHRIMVNTCIDYYRRQQRRQTEDFEQVQPYLSYQPHVLHQIGREEVLDALAELSPVYRAVFNLYVIEGYSHREIGQMLGITESTSRSNLLKARQKLKALLMKKGIEK